MGAGMIPSGADKPTGRSPGGPPVILQKMGSQFCTKIDFSSMGKKRIVGLEFLSKGLEIA